jgi:hypothetical protein
MKKLLSALFLVATCWALVLSIEVRAQTSNACAPYTAAVTSGSGGAVPIVPDALLMNWRFAVGCLVPIIATMNNTMRADSVRADTRAKFLSATGAIRTMANMISAAEVANGKTIPPKADIDTIAKFNTEFQRAANIDTYSVLVTGARSDDYDMRLSAILVLGNIIDEKYACIPLVQILDPNLQAASYLVKARANLLGMLSRITPFVYKEDFANITNILNLIVVPPEDHSLEKTRQILENIRQRLNYQTKQPPPGSPEPNATVPLQHEYKDRCIKYMETYPATDQMKANIKYP